MSNYIKELLEKRAKAVNQGREILTKAEGEKRSLTAEESANYDKFLAEANELDETAKRHSQQEKAEKLLNSMGSESSTSGKAAETKSTGTDSAEYRKALQSYFVRGEQAIKGDEVRALSQGSLPDGGFLVPREQFINTLLKFVDDTVQLKSRATVFQLEKASSLGYPTLDTDMSDADWTSEVGTVQEDTAMKTGKRELSPNMLAKLAKISMKLLQNSAVPSDTLVLQRLGYKFAVTEEKGFILGSGAAQPLGFMVASNLGVPTSRDVSLDNTTSSPTIDGLKNAKFALKPQYWNRAAWMFHRDAVLRISKLKDAENRYIWAESTRDGEPDRLLGIPVLYSEFMPNTFSTGQYVGAIADFSFYHIAECMNFQVQRLNELFALNSQIGFIGRQEVDGMPALAEAFVRVKLA